MDAITTLFSALAALFGAVTGGIGSYKLIEYKLNQNTKDILTNKNELKESIEKVETKCKESVEKVEVNFKDSIKELKNDLANKSDFLNLKESVDKHNNVIERTFVLEESVKSLDKQFKILEHTVFKGGNYE